MLRAIKRLQHEHAMTGLPEQTVQGKRYMQYAYPKILQTWVVMCQQTASWLYCRKRQEQAEAFCVAGPDCL